MEIREPKESEEKVFNSLVTHALQSWEWGEFRETTGVRVIRRIVLDKKKAIAAFQLTIHKIPRTKYTIGYLPKCTMPDKEMLQELRAIGEQENCIFIKLEPNIEKDEVTAVAGSRNDGRLRMNDKLKKSPHPMFTDHAFQLDLTKNEEELLSNMHPKTRYNIKVAQKHAVEIVEDNSDKAFEQYIRLMHETTIRQKYYAHEEAYHRKMWETLKTRNEGESRSTRNKLEAHLLLAKFRLPNSSVRSLVLAAWALFVLNDKLYYPYGTSSREHREVMASNLLMWEAIRFGKKMGCKLFDMWGALGENPDSKHPWYGFHKFKQGYGPRLVEFVGSYDLVLNPFLYQLYNLIHKLRWLYLRAKRN